jgi:MFS transporter, FSR family, fosmidomycin resistance protein
MSDTEENLTETEPFTKKMDDFHTQEIITLAAAHGAHDTYFAYLPTILPLLIKNLALNTTQAGLLSACAQIPNLIQPFIGHLADRKNLKLLVILAPTISGILVSLVGITPSFGMAAILLLLAGFSTAAFHAIAPAMVSARSGEKVGRGMGFFMVGGEMGFGIGPLIIVAAIGILTIRGMPWLMTLGMLASIILWFKLKHVTTVRPVEEEAGLPVKETLMQLRSLMLPIMVIIFLTGFLMAFFVNYLPTFLSMEGVPFSLAGLSLTVVELSATMGVFLMGLFSDRFGQRNIALIGTLFSVAFGYGFLTVHGWLRVVMLVGVGLSAFVSNPAFLAMIQPRFTHNRALANGVYMSTSFVLRSVVVIIIGALSDQFGMRPVFYAGLGLSVLAVPFIFMLPER